MPSRRRLIEERGRGVAPLPIQDAAGIFIVDTGGTTAGCLSGWIVRPDRSHSRRRTDEDIRKLLRIIQPTDRNDGRQYKIAIG